jgi:hypothetical protein
MWEAILLPALILATALLYSSVGHAGASGYVAIMALFGVAPGVMKPAALALNVLVAAIATTRFGRAGCFSWATFWPFAVGSIPMAYLGGALTLPGTVYRPIVGVALWFAAYRLVGSPPGPPSAAARLQSGNALLCGAGIGLISGLTGVGGGIFLGPLLLLKGWAGVRETAGVSAAFNLVNSLAGSCGDVSGVLALPPAFACWAASAVVGGVIGSGLGTHRLGSPTLCRLLALVLAIAGAKLVFL